ncbi:MULTISPECIES: hypothetical protein [Salmonella]
MKHSKGYVFEAKDD